MERPLGPAHEHAARYTFGRATVVTATDRICDTTSRRRVVLNGKHDSTGVSTEKINTRCAFTVRKLVSEYAPSVLGNSIDDRVILPFFKYQALDMLLRFLLKRHIYTRRRFVAIRGTRYFCLHTPQNDG